MAKSSRESDGLIVHERHRNIEHEAINGRDAKEESSVTSDRRDFLKVAVMAAAGAGALPVGAASWASPAAAQSTHSIKGEAYTMKTRKLGRLEVSELGFGNMGLSGGHYGPGVDRPRASV